MALPLCFDGTVFVFAVLVWRHTDGNFRTSYFRRVDQ